MTRATLGGEPGSDRPERRERRHIRVRLGRDGKPAPWWKRYRVKVRKLRGRPLLMVGVIVIGAIILWVALHYLVKDPPMPSD